MAKSDRTNREIQVNSFQKGLMLDASDFVIKPDMGRFLQNVRIVDHQGSSLVVTNLQGTDISFVLTSGFKPVAAQEFSGVLYIISWKESTGELELGSYPSPNYSDLGNPSSAPNFYRPLNNFNSGPFRTDAFSTSSFPIIQRLEIQPEYDQSVNMCFTIKGKTPRIVNTQFKSENNGEIFSIITRDTQGGESSNTYTTASIETETTLLLASTNIMKIAFSAIEAGGKVKPGNYQYVFYYMNDSFNRTSVINQSRTCQVSFGETIDSIKGGDETQETSKRVKLILSNIDQNFRYLKVYMLYNSGQDGLQQQYLEFVQPIEIIGSTMEFFHTGFEELREVSQETVNVDYITVDSASASTQANGYYFLADVTQGSLDVESFRLAAGQISPVFKRYSLSADSLGLAGYSDPGNVYNYMGGIGGESYPYGLVFIMNNGSLSPAFPCRGKNYVTQNEVDAINELGPTYKGIVTFPKSNLSPHFEESGGIGTIKPKYLEFDIATLLSNPTVQATTKGFFFVRGDRRPNMIAQGILIPTIKAPTIEAADGDPSNQNGYDANTNTDDSGAGGYYVTNGGDGDNINVFRHLINLDSILEAFIYNRDGTSNDKYVVDANGSIQDGYIPIYLRDTNAITYSLDGSPPSIKAFMSKNNESKARHWALLSMDALLNEAEFVTSLQRENMGIHQLSKITFNVSGQVTPLINPAISFGAHYKMKSQSLYSDMTVKKVKKGVFVPGESLATGTDFISAMKVALLSDDFASTSAHYWINQLYNSYFGIEIEKTALDDNFLQDATVSPTNPIGGNSRPGKAAYAPIVDARSEYSNLNKDVPAAFLVNIYPTNDPLEPDELYPTIDSVVYKQVSERYTWDEFSSPGANTKINVFGGDCYISRISRKLNHCPERIAGVFQSDAGKRWNIDSGLVITWWQEGKYNGYLRQDKLYDVSETERRSFYPYQSLGDVVKYRKYRYPETTAHSPGYSQLLPPKSFFNLTTLTPIINNRFSSRVYFSEKHIPNAFNNGYRSFLETNFKDYDTALGSIVALFNHRSQLFIVFEHGLAIAPIEQRIQTGGDSAGAIFVEAKDVLPPTPTYISREIGCQHHLSMVQTPSGIFGIDASKKKIWGFSDGLAVISDESVSSWLLQNAIVNPKSGYDFANNEVLFSTDNWTLCYSESLRKFTSFYTMNESNYITRLNNTLYSFINNQAYRHNSDATFQFYGNHKDVIVEFVINKAPESAKVLDFINIISNEVPAKKIEIFSFNQEAQKSLVINPAGLNQYTIVNDGLNQFTEEQNILYRDKKYVVQVPYRTAYSPGSDRDVWGLEGRLRDKVLVVRITYSELVKPLELLNIATFFRYSFS